jgi:glycosyltransferase involved in cell wall biosynthesis
LRIDSSSPYHTGQGSMRILYVTQVVLDRPYGGARHVLAVARHLAARGHAVELLAPGDEVPVPGVRRLRPAAALRPGVRLEAALAAQVSAASLRFSPEVAYLRLSASSALVPRALTALQVPFVVELNGCILDELKKLGRSDPAVAAVRFNLRRVVRRARALVAVEPRVARHAVDALGARNVEVIRNGAELDVATPGDRAEARRRLGLPLDVPLLAFAGTLAPELRFDLLFGALERAPDLHLVLVGDGPQRDRVEAAVRELSPRIAWLGARPHEDAVDALRAGDACINVRDGIVGMKVFEYAAVGRRFATFDVADAAGLEDLYPGLEAVHLIHSRTPEGVLAAARAALGAEAARGPLPDGAVERARGRVGWDHTARQIEALLDQTIRGR